MSDPHSQPVQTREVRDKDGSLIITSGRKYKIRNVGYPWAIIDHTDYNPLGTIGLYTVENDNDPDSQHWKVSVVDTITGNQAVTFESVGVPGYYAGVQQVTKGATLDSLPKPSTWILNPVNPNQYQIKSADGNFFWYINSPSTYYPILLESVAYALEDYGQYAWWYIEPV